MPKLTPERARELRLQGARIDPSKIVRREVAEEAVPVETQAPQPDVSSAAITLLAQVAKAAEDNVSRVLEVQRQQAEILAEVVRPKVKDFQMTIGRRSDGKIGTVSGTITVRTKTS